VQTHGAVGHCRAQRDASEPDAIELSDVRGDPQIDLELRVNASGQCAV